MTEIRQRFGHLLVSRCRGLFAYFALAGSCQDRLIFGLARTTDCGFDIFSDKASIDYIRTLPTKFDIQSRQNGKELSNPFWKPARVGNENTVKCATPDELRSHPTSFVQINMSEEIRSFPATTTWSSPLPRKLLLRNCGTAGWISVTGLNNHV